MKKCTPLKSKQMWHKVGIAAVYAFFISGCANIPAPTEQIAVSKVEISNAANAGGNEFAPLSLKAAMDKMDSAEQAMTQKNYLSARQLAEQAEVDAQLAGATARSAKAQKAASALQDDNRVLHQELDRKTQ